MKIRKANRIEERNSYTGTCGGHVYAKECGMIQRLSILFHSECISCHGDRAKLTVVVEHKGLFVLSGSKNIDEWKEMLRSRYGVSGIWNGFVVHNLVVISIFHIFCNETN